MLLHVLKETGFTLIELIAVIVLISILSVVALSRLDGLGVFEEKAFFDEVTNAFRYAQKLAQSTGCNVRVSTTLTSYQLQQGDSCASTSYINVLNPVNRVHYQNTNPPPGVTIAPTAIVIFTPQSTVTGLSGDTPFSVGSYSFTVHNNTGLVSVN